MSDFKVGDNVRFGDSGVVWEVRQTRVDGNPQITLLRSAEYGYSLDRHGLTAAIKTEPVQLFELRPPKAGEQYMHADSLRTASFDYESDFFVLVGERYQ